MVGELPPALLNFNLVVGADSCLENMMAQELKVKHQGGIAASLVGALIGFGVGKLAAWGIQVGPEAQAAITVAVYGVVHRLLGRWGI